MVQFLPSATAQQAPVVPKWAKDFLQSWYAVYNAGDAAGVASLFTADGTLGPDKGRAAIAASLEKAFAATRYRCEGKFDGLRELNGLAAAWGVETCTETPKSKGQPVATKERWLIVFEHQADGKWLILRETWEDLKP